jgi:hypothetical protein
MQLRPGLRLRSQACATEVIVTRAPAGEIALACGGHPMVAIDSPPASPREVAAGYDAGNLLGKRYTSPDDAALEVLVTRAGTGTLSDGRLPLVVKEARPLPASD